MQNLEVEEEGLSELGFYNLDIIAYWWALNWECSYNLALKCLVFAPLSTDSCSSEDLSYKI